jgi:hypothetical protein
VVQTWGDTSKKPVTVSLNYSAEFNVPSAVRLIQSTDLKVIDASRPLYAAFTDANVTLPKFTLLVGQPSDGDRATNVSAQYKDSEFVNLTLQRVATVEMKIVTDQNNSTNGKKVIWRGDVPIPTPELYDLPIPKAALFGAQKFTLTLSEAGAITAVEYGKNTGAAGPANAAGSIATALSPETVAAKAADLKAQADLIAQQQRLHRCQLNPTACQ